MPVKCSFVYSAVSGGQFQEGKKYKQQGYWRKDEGMLLILDCTPFEVADRLTVPPKTFNMHSLSICHFRTKRVKVMQR